MVVRWEELGTVRADWAHVTQRLGRHRFFHQIDYLDAALTSVLEADRDHVRCLHLSARAILPLRSRRLRLNGLPLRVLDALQHPVIDLYDALLGPDDVDATRVLLEGLGSAGGWDLVWLPRVLAESSLLDHLRRLKPRGLVIREVGESKSVSLRGGYAGVEARISHKFLVNERRKLKKLSQQGKVEHQTFFPTERGDPAFLEFLRLEAAGWKGRVHSTIEGSPRVRAFFEGLVERMGPTQRCRIDHLCVDGVPIAGQLALICGRTMSLLKIGYDERYHAVGPGGLLLHETLRQLGSGAHKLDELSFVTGARWNDAWGAAAQAVYDVRIYNDTPIGRLAQGLHELRPYVRRGLAWAKKKQRDAAQAPTARAGGDDP